jgi:hypothetical protein
VIHWNSVAATAIAVGRAQASSAVLGGMVNGAMYDAVAAVEGGLEPFATGVTSPPGASADAAVAQASRDVLVARVPGQAAAVQAEYITYMASIPEAAAKEAGKAVGTAAAAGMLAMRTGDHFDDVVPYVQPTPGPGVFEPIAPTPPVDPKLAFVRPFTYESLAAVTLGAILLPSLIESRPLERVPKLPYSAREGVNKRGGGPAVDTYHVVLYIHLLALFIGIGAASVLLVCLLQLRSARTLAEAAPWGAVAGKTARVFPIAVLGLFGTGAYMTTDVWSWSTGWIDVSIAGLVLLALQGPLVAERTAKKLERALHDNGPGPLGEKARGMTRHPGLWVAELSNIGLVLGVVWIMTQKPGTASAIAAIIGGYAVGAALGMRFTRAPAEESTAATEAAA